MQHETYKFGDFELDPVRRALSRAGEQVRLRPMAVSLLCHLAQENDRVVPKEELLSTLWPDGTGSEANLTVTIAAVRKALGEEPGQHRLLITVPREGYRFVGELLEEGPHATGSNSPRIIPRKLAVLPPEIVQGSGDSALNSDLAQRICEQIIGHASKLDTTEIIETCAENLDSGPLGELASAVGAEALLTGTLTRNEASVQLDLRITDREDRTRWQSRVVHTIEELHTLPLRAARIVTGILNPDPGRPPRTTPARGAEYSAAWRSYLQGRYSLAIGGGLPAAHQSAVAFQHAVELEPDLAPAHAGLAEVLFIQRSAGIVEREASTKRIRMAAETAFELEPLLAESHLAMAQVAMVLDHDWIAAREHLMSALDFGPDNPAVHARYAIYLAWRRQFEAALDSIRRAQSLDPFSLRLTSEAAKIHYFAGQSDVALSILHSATQRNLDFSTGWILSAWINLGAGNGRGSLRALEQVREQIEAAPLFDAFSGTAWAIEGNTERAHAALDALKKRESAGEDVPALFAGLILVSLGDLGGATECVRRAGEERYSELATVEADPLWAAMRSWPAYGPLRQRFFAKGFPVG
ncbi:hypothetical protein DRQ53_11330 [bacterium]|nr:MAG: hypothetical protein DRQ53_11330 [bacterium]